MIKKVYIITGASSGIGQEVARQLASPSVVLVLASRSNTKLTLLANELLLKHQTEVLVVPSDMTVADDIERLVDVTIEKYGRIDYLLSAAGRGNFKQAVFHEYEEYLDYFKLNSIGMMYLSNLVSQRMIEQGSGHISFIASVAGLIATPSSSVYSATKFAIIGYANALRLELGRFGVTVSTINPGPVKTNFFNHSTENRNYYMKIAPIALEVEEVAEKIVKNMHRKYPKRELTLPYYFSLLNKLYVLFPNSGDFLIRKALNFKEE